VTSPWTPIFDQEALRASAHSLCCFISSHFLQRYLPHWHLNYPHALPAVYLAIPPAMMIRCAERRNSILSFSALRGMLFGQPKTRYSMTLRGHARIVLSAQLDRKSGRSPHCPTLPQLTEDFRSMFHVFFTYQPSEGRWIPHDIPRGSLALPLLRYFTRVIWRQQWRTTVHGTRKDERMGIRDGGWRSSVVHGPLTMRSRPIRRIRSCWDRIETWRVMHDAPVPGHPLAHTGACTTHLWTCIMLMRCRSTRRWCAHITLRSRRPSRIHEPMRDSRGFTVVSLQTSCACSKGTCVTFVVYEKYAWLLKHTAVRRAEGVR
jgi:hypothetical protein